MPILPSSAGRAGGHHSQLLQILDHISNYRLHRFLEYNFLTRDGYLIALATDSEFEASSRLSSKFKVTA